MKKHVFYICLLAAVLLLLSIIPSAFAAGTPTFSVSNAEGSPGDEVKLTVDVSNNPGVICIGLDITYDPAVLELKAANAASFGTLSFGPVSNIPFKLSWDESLKPNNTSNGSIVELTFAIKSNAALGDSVVAVSYDPDNVFNSDYDNVTFSVQSGKVRVKEKVINVTGVTTESNASILIGAKKTLSYTVQPANATNTKVTFSSSNPSVATVDAATGEITGVKRGNATITVKTEDGNHTATCNVTVTCSHGNVNHVAEKASTCTERGWDRYSTCNICGQMLDKNGNEISGIPYRALLQHTSGGIVREREVAPTCEREGSYDEVSYCTVCHNEISRVTKKVAALGHQWDGGTITAQPDCTHNGTKTFVCGRDSNHKKTETINALGHDWGEWVQTKAPTETEPGSETRTCKRDHSHTETRSIPELGHKHQMVLQPAKEPTYTEEGNIAYYVCSGCEKWFLDEEGKQEITDKDSVVIPVLAPEQKNYNISFEGGATWDKGSEEDFVVSADGEALIDHILIDGEKIDKVNYDVDNGPRTVTLKAEYLKTISTGEHTITVVTTDGEGSAIFTVTENTLPTEEPTEEPTPTEADITPAPETAAPETPEVPATTEKPANQTEEPSDVKPAGSFNWWMVTTFLFAFLFVAALVVIFLLFKREKKGGK